MLDLQPKKIIKKIDFKICREQNTGRENKIPLRREEDKVLRKVIKAITISQSNINRMTKVVIQTRQKNMNKKDINDQYCKDTSSKILLITANELLLNFAF